MMQPIELLYMVISFELVLTTGIQVPYDSWLGGCRLDQSKYNDKKREEKSSNPHGGES